MACKVSSKKVERGLIIDLSFDCGCRMDKERLYFCEKHTKENDFP
jgi:hypothetical protein